MSANHRVVHRRRATITALPLYYSGHLLKKQDKDKDFKEFYAELRGATLFLYKDDTQDTYTEKLDLEQLKSMQVDSLYQKKTGSTFTLTLHTEEVQLKIDNADTGEEWRGYILTVARKEIPSNLRLLPGQMLLLQDTLDQERRRNPPVACPPRPPIPPLPPLPPRPAFRLPTSSSSSTLPLSKDKPEHSSPEMPSCYYDVTRKEAEQMLEANPEYGSIIIRPSTLANNYALTLRQNTPSGPAMKNYRVTSTNSGFVIELDTPVPVSSLNDVLEYFLAKTEYRLHPYVESQPYETHIVVLPAPRRASFTAPSTKIIPKAQVAPIMHRQTLQEPLTDPTIPGESEYVVPEDQSCDDHNLKLGMDELEDMLDRELGKVLRLRRENLYSVTSGDTGTTHQEQTAEKSHSVGWADESESN